MCKVWFILKLVGVMAIMALWSFVSLVSFRVVNGPDPGFDLGGNYEMCFWPGFIIHWQSREEGEYEDVIYPERVTAISVDSDWIVGKTDKGFFAICKKSDEVFYPYKTYDQLQSACCLSISINNLTTTFPSQYEKLDYTCLPSILSVTIPAALFSMVVVIIGFERSGRLLVFPFVWLKITISFRICLKLLRADVCTVVVILLAKELNSPAVASKIVFLRTGAVIPLSAKTLGPTMFFANLLKFFISKRDNP